MKISIFAHLLLYNTNLDIARSIIDQLLDQETGAELSLKILVSDNSSSPDLYNLLSRKYCASGEEKIYFKKFEENIGFCGGHNFGAGEALRGDFDFFVTLNPDLFLPKDCFLKLSDKLIELSRKNDGKPFLFTPLLLRADQKQQPLFPEIVDSAGIIMTKSLRHFDRGAGGGAEFYREDEEVFGGTGAFLAFNRSAIHTLELRSDDESALDKIYPQLAKERELRQHIFDEAFFAYREDAELAWRAQALGVKCFFSPAVKAYHIRQVTPERRASTSSFINALSVRNRFLLQLNNLSLFELICLPKAILRDLFVVCAVLIYERASIKALFEVYMLWSRARLRHKKLLGIRKVEGKKIIDNFFTK